MPRLKSLFPQVLDQKKVRVFCLVFYVTGDDFARKVLLTLKYRENSAAERRLVGRVCVGALLPEARIDRSRALAPSIETVFAYRISLL